MSANNPHTLFSGPELCRLSAYEAVSLLKKREVSPKELIESAYSRIQQVEPAINATPILCEERAYQAAAALQPVPEVQQPAGYLAGLPIAIKDLTDVQGLVTTYGSLGMKDNIARQSDPLVELLEQRSGVVVGKTNTPEFGAGGNTFNEVFGKTRNPWDTRKNAGGSSGGAAASLASGEVWLSHGSDLAGSLRTPAAYCGIVGLRPSPGRCGGAPSTIAFNMEAVSGPMARSVLDTALFLDAMVGYDPRLPISLEAPAESFQSAVLQAEAKGMRIAFSPDLHALTPVEPEIDQILRRALQQVATCGVVVDEACPELPQLEPTYVTLRALVWASLPGRLPLSIQQHYKRTLRENIEVGRKLTVDEVINANVNRSQLYRNMQQFLSQFDVLACPVVGLEPGSVDEEYPMVVAGQPMEDYLSWLKFSYLSTVTGLPALSLPVGFTQSGMPVGLQLIGPPRGEARLLAVAKVIEDCLALPTQPIDPRVFSTGV